MPSLARPDVDVLEGVSAAIIVDQERMGANSRSTVGTATDAHALLRIVFSRLGEPSAGPAFHYSFNTPAGACPNCEGRGSVTDIDLDELFDADKSLNGGAITVPGYTPDGWLVRVFSESGLLDGDKPIRDYTADERQSFLYSEPVKVKIATINMTYEGLVPRVRKSFLAKDKESLQPHLRAFVDRAVTFTDCPDCGGARLNQAALASRIGELNIADAARLQISDLADWVRDHPRPAVGRPAGADPAADAGLVRGDRSRLPQPGPSLGHAVGRRGPADQDDPAPRLQPDRRQLRVRRADDRSAPARHPADERTAGAAAGQGQHRAGGGAQAGGDPDRRLRGRPRAAGGGERRTGLLHGDGRGAADQRHADRSAPRRPGATQDVDPDADRQPGHPRRPSAQPARRRRGHPARRADCGHRGRRLREELADPLLDAARRGGDLGRPDRDQGFTPQQPGHLHRTAGQRPVGVRQGQQGETRTVQRQLRGCLPALQRPRRRLHRPGHDGRGGDDLRGVQRTALHRRGAAVHARRPDHRRRVRDVGRRRARLLHQGSRPRDPVPDAGRRTRLPRHRSAVDHAVRRRASAAQAGHPHGRQGRRLRARRADHGAAPGRRAAAARSARRTGRRRQDGDRDRAPPGGDGARGLDHRPRARARATTAVGSSSRAPPRPWWPTARP